MSRSFSFSRARLSVCTTLTSIVAFSLLSAGTAWAACSTSVPTNGQTVTCSGADITGISGNANTVTLSFPSTGTISTTGVSAIDLGTVANINIQNSSSVSSNVDAITIDSGTVILGGGSSISSTTGSGIKYTGAAAGSFYVQIAGTVTGGNGVAVDMGQSNGTFQHFGGTVTGNVVAGSGVTDTFTLRGGSPRTLNVDEFATKYTGFEIFQKQDANTWTLTGTGSQSWAITVGTLQGNATSMSGALAVSSGANATFNETGTGGIYSSVISGAGAVSSIGTGDIRFSGTNTYTGGTTVSNGTLFVSNDVNLGNVSGALTLSNGGILRRTGAGALAIARNVVLGTGGGIIHSNGNDVTLSGVVSSTGGLTKTGSGVLVLSNTNTYTGGTTINAGTVSIGADNNLGGTGSVTINNGATLQFSAGLTSARDVSLASGMGTINTTGASTLSGVISGSGALEKAGAGSLTLSNTNTYTGGTNITGGTLIASADNNLGGAGAITLNGGTLQYGATFTTARNVTLGASGGTINSNGFAPIISGVISGTGSLTKSGAGGLIVSGANTYTGGTTVTNGTLQGTLSSLQGNVNLSSGSSQLFFAGGGSGTFSGTITGSGAVRKNNTSVITFSGTNTYSGGTILSAGTIITLAEASLGDAAGILTLDGGTLEYGAGFSSTRAIAVGASNGTINTNGFNSSTSGVISGVGTLTKTGAGTLTLSGTNTYTGGTNINGGVLQVSLDDRLGDVSGGITFNGGTLRITSSSFSTARNIALTGNGIWDSNGLNSTASGVISGSGSFTVIGSNGVLSLSGINTYTGGTIVTNGGVVGISQNNQLGNVSGSLTLDNGTLRRSGGAPNIARSVILGAGGGTINSNGSNMTVSGVISGTGSLTKTNAGTLTLSGNNTYSGGATTVNSGTLNVSADNNLGAAGNSITLNGGTLQYGAGFTSSRAVSLGASNGTVDTNGFNSSISGVISGTGSLTKTGTGTLYLTGTSNTYSGGNIVSGGSLVGNTSGIIGNVALGAGTDLTFQQATNGTYSGIISGTGAVNKIGSGTVTLSGANTYNFYTYVGGGTLNVSAENNLGNVAGIIYLDTGATLQYGAGFSSSRNIGLSGNSTIDTNSFNSTISGVVSSTGSLTKIGTGTLTLSGTNTYSGTTTVSAGKLIVNGSTTSATTIASGASLGGIGTVSSVVNNGTLAPGNSIGTLNVNGNLTFNNGSIYDVEVDDAGNSDKIIATGAITINGGTVNVLATAGTYGSSTNYTILQGASRTGTFTGVTSNFAFLTPNLTYTANSVDLALARNGSSFSSIGNDDTQKGVAQAVEGLGAGNALYDAFLTLSSDDAPKALDTLSGEHNTGLSSASMTSGTMVMDTVAARVQTLMPSSVVGADRMALAGDNISQYDVREQSFAVLEPSAGGALEAAKGNRNVWTEVFGSFGKSDSRGTSPSQERNSTGMLVGADMPLGNKSYIGAFGGWERGEVYTDTQGANSDVETWHGGLYSSYFIDSNWRLSGGLIGSYHDINTTRHIAFAGFNQTARGETDGYAAAAFAEAGYSFDFSDIAIEPFAGLNVQHSTIGGYRETNGGAANLDVESVSQTIPGHRIGIRAGKNFETYWGRDLNIHGSLGWDHNYGDLSTNSRMRFVGGASSFLVKGSEIARDSAVVGAGLDLDLQESTSGYLGYDGSFSEQDRNHSLSLGIKMKF